MEPDIPLVRRDRVESLLSKRQCGFLIHYKVFCLFVFGESHTAGQLKVSKVCIYECYQGVGISLVFP